MAMAVKHVHFAHDVSYPQTPSPTYSATSLPSSYGPSTPPQAMYNSYLPGQVVMHPGLVYTAKPGFYFDVSLPAANVKLQASTLNECATNPALPSLVIVHPWLRWQITIRPREGQWVRVRDVLAGIYEALRVSATASDYDSLTTRAEQSEVTAAFGRRWMRIPDPALQTVEKSKGLKRVDFLRSYVRFCGLRLTPQGWEMVVS